MHASLAPSTDAPLAPGFSSPAAGTLQIVSGTDVLQYRIIKVSV